GRDVIDEGGRGERARRGVGAGVCRERVEDDEVAVATDAPAVVQRVDDLRGDGRLGARHLAYGRGQHAVVGGDEDFAVAVRVVGRTVVAVGVGNGGRVREEGDGRSLTLAGYVVARAAGDRGRVVEDGTRQRAGGERDLCEGVSDSVIDVDFGVAVGVRAAVGRGEGARRDESDARACVVDGGVAVVVGHEGAAARAAGARAQGGGRVCDARESARAQIEVAGVCAARQTRIGHVRNAE